MNKFKVGDRVRILNEKIPNHYPIKFLNMDQVCIINRAVCGDYTLKGFHDHIVFMEHWLIGENEVVDKNPLPHIEAGDLVRITGEDGLLYVNSFEDKLLVKGIGYFLVELCKDSIEEVWRDGDRIWINMHEEPLMSVFLNEVLDSIEKLIDKRSN